MGILDAAEIVDKVFFKSFSSSRRVPIQVQQQVGPFTMDNASVNPTFMTHLQLALETHGHPDFDATHDFVRCFSHIINLCSQAVIKKMEDDDAQGEHPETDTEPATATDDAEDEDAGLLAPRTTR
jgi:hypothetical protein